MRDELNITENEAKYLKFIYRRQCEELVKVRVTTMARSFNVTPTTVTEVIQNLSKKNLLRYKRYRGVQLTEKGIEEAQKLLRKHRILEVLFVNLLKYDVQKSCIEASRLDYHVSTALINAICQTYGHPRVCPCKKTIFSDLKCGCEMVGARR